MINFKGNNSENKGDFQDIEQALSEDLDRTVQQVTPESLNEQAEKIVPKGKEEGPRYFSHIEKQAPQRKKVVKEQERGVNPYNFQRQQKLSKEQLRTLQMLHEDFARQFSTALSLYLRTRAEISLAFVDQVPFRDFVESMPNPTNITIFSMRPLEGMSIFEINQQLVVCIIDRLLGGSGKLHEKSRELTEIEQTIIKDIIIRAFENLKNVWQRISPLDFKLEARENNPQFVQIVAAGELVVVMSFQCKIGEISNKINICIPYGTLNPILSQLSALYRLGKSKKKGDPKYQAIIKNRMKNVKVCVVAEVGNIRLSVEDLMKIRIGDVLKLHNYHNVIKIKVDTYPVFYGHIESLEKKNLVRITSIIEQEDVEENEN